LASSARAASAARSTSARRNRSCTAARWAATAAATGARVRRPVRRLDAQTRPGQGGQLAVRRAGAQPVQRRLEEADLGVYADLFAAAGVGRLAGEDLAQDGPEAEDVAAAVETPGLAAGPCSGGM